MELQNSNVQMRLYGIFNFSTTIYFDNLDDIKEYILTNNISKENVFVIEYIENFAGRCDVIRKSYANKKIILLTVIDELGYAECNIERSYREGEFCWEYYEGDLRKEYDIFRKKGIHFKNDIYQKFDDDCEWLRNLYEERKSGK